MSITLGVGTRLPAHATSMGQVLIAGLPSDALDRYLALRPLRRLAPSTITDETRFRERLERVRRAGYALVDEELELGLRSVACPIIGAAGKPIAAINVSTASARVALTRLRKEFVPLLQAAAAEIPQGFVLRGTRG